MNKVLKIAIVVVLCLIVILTITLFAFNGNNNQGGSTTSSTTTSSTTGGGKPDCTEHVDANEDKVCDTCGDPIEDTTPPACTEHTDEDNNNLCDTCGTEIQSSSTEDGFTATNDKVYVITDGLHLRPTPSASETALGWVTQDTELERIGYYANGWSKVLYEGNEVYVYTGYVTTSKPITSFTEVRETVYFTKNCFAFTKPSHIEGYSESDYTCYEGHSAVRTGVATEVYLGTDGVEYTFARVEIEVENEDGTSTTIVRYVNNSYLSTNPNPQEGDLVFTEQNDTLLVLAESFKMRVSPKILDDNSNIGKYVVAGTVLQRVGIATDEEGTVWSKVIYEGKTYYVIASNPDYITVRPESNTYSETFKLFGGKYIIVLPSAYDIVGDANNKYKLSGNASTITVENSGVMTGTSATEYAQSLIGGIEVADIEVKTTDKITYFEYVEGEYYYLVAIVAGTEDDFYVTTFSSKETNTNIFLTYAGQITIKKS